MLVPKKTPQDKIILLQPKLIKIIKKALPLIRSRYTAKELTQITLQIINEMKQIKDVKETN